MNPEISIIVPVYNVEKYLSRCIESLISQTFPDIEIILINDGSTDKSPEICSRYSELDSRIIVHDQPNQGVSASRNKGIEIAAGKYIMFVDSDDYCEPEYCEKMLEMITMQDVDLGICALNVRCSVTGEFLEEIKWSDSETIEKYDKKIIHELRKKCLLISLWNKIYRSEIVKKIRFDTGRAYGEDFSFVMGYIREVSRKIAICSKPLYNYSKGVDNSLSNKFIYNLWENFIREFREYDETLETCGIKIEKISPDYYDLWIDAVVRIFKNYDSKKCPVKGIKKYREIQKILDTEICRKAVKKASFQGINGIIAAAIKTRFCLLIQIAFTLQKIKKRILKKGE